MNTLKAEKGTLRDAKEGKKLTDDVVDIRKATFKEEANTKYVSSIRSSCPCRSIRARLAVVSSTRLIWIRGYLRAKSAISEGRIQEENKLLPPRVSVPFFRSPQSFANPSNSFWI